MPLVISNNLNLILNVFFKVDSLIEFITEIHKLDYIYFIDKSTSCSVYISVPQRLDE